MTSRVLTPAYGSTLPRASVPREEGARHATLLRAVTTPRSRTALTGVALVVLLTFVGMFYLSQTLEAASARYTIDSLLRDRQAMLMELKTQEGSTLHWGSEQQVRGWARAELDPLGALVRVPDR